jgi:hypothetical protein
MSFVVLLPIAVVVGLKITQGVAVVLEQASISEEGHHHIDNTRR